MARNRPGGSWGGSSTVFFDGVHNIHSHYLDPSQAISKLKNKTTLFTCLVHFLYTTVQSSTARLRLLLYCYGLFQREANPARPHLHDKRQETLPGHHCATTASQRPIGIILRVVLQRRSHGIVVLVRGIETKPTTPSTKYMATSSSHDSTDTPLLDQN